MLPDPLHPAVVHFPIVFMAVLPLVAAGALWAIRRGAAPARAWAVPVALSILLTLSAWAALQTGEAQEDRAEDLVGEQVLQRHEEAAERFLLLSGIVLAIGAAGLLRGPAGRAARAVATVAAAGLLVAGYQVGHSGGAVAYGDGASAGVSQLSAGAQRDARPGPEADDD